MIFETSVAYVQVCPVCIGGCLPAVPITCPNVSPSTGSSKSLPGFSNTWYSKRQFPISNSALGVLEGVYRPVVPITRPNISTTRSWESSTSTLCLLISRAGGTKTLWAAAVRNPSAVPLKCFATCWDKFLEMRASESARFCRWGNFCCNCVSAAGPMADSGCSDHKCQPYLPAVWNSKWQNWQRMLISKLVSNWGPVESPHHRVCQCCQSHRSYYSYCVGVPLAYSQPLAGICGN